MKPRSMFSKLLPSASSCSDWMGTETSSWMLAGLLPSRKNRHPADSSSLLILIRAVASFCDVGMGIE